MGKLVDVVRVLHITDSFSNPLHPFHSRILAAAYVGYVIVTLVLDWPHGIKSPGSVIDIFKILSRTSLITHAPNQDAGMVVVGGDHLDHSGHMSVFPFDGMRQ